MFIGDNNVFDSMMNPSVVMKSELLTSGTSWSIPANLLNDTVWVSGISGGEGAVSFNAPAGDGGSPITKYPYDVSGGTVTYSIGSGGAGGGSNGSNTVWGSITLIGGGASGAWGSRGSASATGYNSDIPGFYGVDTNDPKTGSGLMFNGTQYGFGGGGLSAGGDGCIFLEWMESV